MKLPLQNIPKCNIKEYIFQNFLRGHASRSSCIAMLAMHADNFMSFGQLEGPLHLVTMPDLEPPLENSGYMPIVSYHAVLFEQLLIDMHCNSTITGLGLKYMPVQHHRLT